MITGMHVILYSRHAENARSFLTDGPVADRGWGLLTTLVLPGGERIGLYERRHPSPLSPARITGNEAAS
jgi:hypothetical protein